MKRTGKKREIRWIIYACLLLFSLGCFLVNEAAAVHKEAVAIHNEESTQESSEIEKTSDIVKTPNIKETSVIKETEDFAELEVHFIDVGQGDCILVLCDGT